MASPEFRQKGTRKSAMAEVLVVMLIVIPTLTLMVWLKNLTSSGRGNSPEAEAIRDELRNRAPLDPDAD